MQSERAWNQINLIHAPGVIGMGGPHHHHHHYHPSSLDGIEEAALMKWCQVALSLISCLVSIWLGVLEVDGKEDPELGAAFQPEPSQYYCTYGNQKLYS